MRTIGVAIPIPDPYGAELQRWRESFGDPLARSIPTHITLMPPTPVDAAALGSIERHLRDVAATERAFPIRLYGTATFRPVSPVVFVALAEGAGACTRVERKVRSGPLWRSPRFPFHPHVTVAHDLTDEALDRAAKELGHYDARFSVSGFALYEHGSDGIWRPQRDFPFGDTGSPEPG
ncbi:2'-5' RNA ligase family protein [Actinomadura alba]|uniref:2'-5' RNA ligase family protein n=1 Tax=Actinomadura alba TaxID=406431 RepID=A0ABR7LIJ7_9ACTN|nr:2'-5' RNA ligase family protein [Actinomadura alba]